MYQKCGSVTAKKFLKIEIFLPIPKNSEKSSFTLNLQIIPVKNSII